jgi:class 3 adenylate cyclase
LIALADEKDEEKDESKVEKGSPKSRFIYQFKVPTEYQGAVKLFIPSGELSVSDALRRVNSPASSTGVIRPNLRSVEEDFAALLDDPVFHQTDQLNREIEQLRQKVAEQAKTITAAQTGTAEQTKRVRALEATVAEWESKVALGFLLDRVHPDAQKRLLESDDFRGKFLGEDRECNAFVMSVDIRRSTELMLKARTPQDFARFTTDLCSELTRIIIDVLGVFDKFTGDGVLAFFPDFYAGKDAAYRVMAAADACHRAFERHYHDSRKLFTSVLKDVGLGIGIDYGPVRFAKLAGGLTVVGVPVVYACRLSAAPPGVTLVNQPAYDAIIDKFGPYCFVTESDVEIKHEGRTIVYQMRLSSRPYTAASPDWKDGGPLTALENSTS